MKKLVWIVTIVLVGGFAAIAVTNLRDRDPRPEAGEHGAETEHGDGEGEAHAAEPIALSPEAVASNGLTFAVAGPGVVRVDIELPGEVVLNSDRVVHVVPRFPGIVEAVNKNLGDEVAAGEVLAVIQSNASLSSYEILAQVAGTVIEKHIALGEFARDDADVFVIADLTTVWVNISVYSRYLPEVRAGQRVRLSARGVADVVETEIGYVRPILGENTRAAVARAVLPNPRGAWQPGLFVTAHVTVDESRFPVVIPDTAIQRVGGEPVVFVRRPEGFFPRHVELGATDGLSWEVKSGLAKSELYVSSNSFILKAELGKSEAEHSH